MSWTCWRCRPHRGHARVPSIARLGCPASSPISRKRRSVDAGVNWRLSRSSTEGLTTVAEIDSNLSDPGGRRGPVLPWADCSWGTTWVLGPGCCGATVVSEIDKAPDGHRASMGGDRCGISWLQLDPGARGIEDLRQAAGADAGVLAEGRLPDDGDIAVRVALDHRGLHVVCARAMRGARDSGYPQRDALVPRRSGPSGNSPGHCCSRKSGAGRASAA